MSNEEQINSEIQENPKQFIYLSKYINPVAILIIISLLVRFLVMKSATGYENDINTFKAWSLHLNSDGLKNFYYTKMFADYPPAYMYVLYIIGVITDVLKIPYSPVVNSSVTPLDYYKLLVELPAVICDVITTVLLYKIAIKKFSTNVAFFLALIFALNPAIITDSADWGQVDSINTLLLIISLNMLIDSYEKFKENKEKFNYTILFSYFIYVVALLTKPQSLIFAPIYIFSFLYYLLKIESLTGKLIFSAASTCGSFILLTIICLPFMRGLDYGIIYSHYVGTLNSYDYNSLYAYNVQLLLGDSFTPTTKAFLWKITYGELGTFSIIIISLISFIYLAINQFKANSIFFIAAFLNTGTFLFSTKMHERYLYPTLVFLLLSYIYEKNKDYLILFAGFTITLFINCTDVLRMIHLDETEKAADGVQHVMQYGEHLIPIINVILFVYMVLSLVDGLVKKAELNEDIESNSNFRVEIMEPLKPISKKKLTKIDYIFICTITLLYGFIAIYNLGNNNNPQTTYTANAGDSVIVSFANEEKIDSVTALLGARIDKTVIFSWVDSKTKKSMSKSFDYKTVFFWDKTKLSADTDKIIVSFTNDESMFQEMAFLDSNNKVIPIAKYNSTNKNVNLFDEQNLVQPTETYMNSTYFDEIYHPRTAYEFVHHLQVYEFTHPPLGKDIMAIFIYYLGMNPFAYRLPGAITGIIMLPFLYLLAREMFKSSFWAMFATILLAADFMHFTQTRIATIDSYVTLFIIIMYYFMYKYYDSSFYYEPLKKSLTTLFWCGIFMGIGCACKWTGIYAASGLAVIFILVMYNRYQEYLYMKSHEILDIKAKFFPLTITTCLASILFFVIIPIIIYCLAYIPYLHTPSMKMVDATGAFSLNTSLQSIWQNQKDMLYYHAHLKSTHPFESSWWAWPIMARPIYYYANTFSNTLKAGISAFGNPAVWWTGLIALFYMIGKVRSKNQKLIVFILVGYFAQLMPWILISRTTYIYHYFPSVPFVVLMVTFMFKDYFNDKINKFVIGYLVLVIVLFIAFYPVISGMPVNANYVYNFLRWFQTWQLIP